MRADVYDLAQGCRPELGRRDPRILEVFAFMSDDFDGCRGSKGGGGTPPANDN